MLNKFVMWLISYLQKYINIFLAIIFLFLSNTTIAALEYLAVSETAAIIYDQPSPVYGKKLYVLKRFTPVEVIVKSGDWARIRDAEGSLAWIEIKNLSNDRTVVVITNKAELKGLPSDNAPVQFLADKWTAFSLLKIEDNGWVKIRHVNGAIAYGKTSQFWGI